MNACDASMNAKTAKINWLGNKLIGITGEKRLSITDFRGKDEHTEDKAWTEHKAQTEDKTWTEDKAQTDDKAWDGK